MEQNKIPDPAPCVWTHIIGQTYHCRIHGHTRGDN